MNTAQGSKRYDLHIQGLSKTADKREAVLFLAKKTKLSNEKAIALIKQKATIRRNISRDEAVALKQVFAKVGIALAAKYNAPHPVPVVVPQEPPALPSEPVEVSTKGEGHGPVFLENLFLLLSAILASTMVLTFNAIALLFDVKEVEAHAVIYSVGLIWSLYRHFVASGPRKPGFKCTPMVKKITPDEAPKWYEIARYLAPKSKEVELYRYVSMRDFDVITGKMNGKHAVFIPDEAFGHEKTHLALILGKLCDAAYELNWPRITFKASCIEFVMEMTKSESNKLAATGTRSARAGLLTGVVVGGPAGAIVGGGMAATGAVATAGAGMIVVLPALGYLIGVLALMIAFLPAKLLFFCIGRGSGRCLKPLINRYFSSKDDFEKAYAAGLETCRGLMDENQYSPDHYNEANGWRVKRQLAP